MLAKEVDERFADPVNPITVKTAVGEDQVAYLYEHQSEFPGVQIQQTYLRHYPFQALAAQILGYVGEVSQDELDAPAEALPPRRQGRQGRASRRSSTSTSAARRVRRRSRSTRSAGRRGRSRHGATRASARPSG